MSLFTNPPPELQNCKNIFFFDKTKYEMHVPKVESLSLVNHKSSMLQILLQYVLASPNVTRNY